MKALLVLLLALTISSCNIERSVNPKNETSNIELEYLDDVYASLKKSFDGLRLELYEFATSNPNKYGSIYKNLRQFNEDADSLIFRIIENIQFNRFSSEITSKDVLILLDQSLEINEYMSVEKLPSYSKLLLLFQDKKTSKIIDTWPNDLIAKRMRNYITLLQYDIFLSGINLTKSYEGSFNKAWVTVNPKKRSISAGETYEARISLSVIDTTIWPRIRCAFNGAELEEMQIDKNGMGILKAKFNQPGIKILDGVYSFVWANNQIAEYSFKDTIVVK